MTTDLDVLVDLERLYEKSIPCEFHPNGDASPCVRPAEWRMEKDCGHSLYFCNPCKEIAIEIYRKQDDGIWDTECFECSTAFKSWQVRFYRL